MKLSDIQAEWAKDCPIDKNDLLGETGRIPILHQKYLTMLSNERITYRVLIENKKKLIQKLEDYFSGKLDGKDIGRDPWQLNETKSAIDKRIDTDHEVIEYNLKTFQQEEKMLYLKEVVGQINSRTYQIGNAGKMLIFMQGNLV